MTTSKLDLTKKEEEKKSSAPSDPWYSCCAQGCKLKPVVLRGGEAYCGFHVDRPKFAHALISNKLQMAQEIVTMANMFDRTKDFANQEEIHKRFYSYVQIHNKAELAKLKESRSTGVRPAYVPFFIPAAKTIKYGPDYYSAIPNVCLMRAVDLMIERLQFRNQHDGYDRDELPNVQPRKKEKVAGKLTDDDDDKIEVKPSKKLMEKLTELEQKFNEKHSLPRITRTDQSTARSRFYDDDRPF